MTISWMALKDARALKGWTQAELAEAVDVHPKTIVNWESNGVPPKSEYKVVRALGDHLRFAVYVNAMPDGFAPLTYDEWLVQERETNLDAMAEYESNVRNHGEAYAKAFGQEAVEHADLQRELDQEDYDRRVSEVNELERFDTIALLNEVTRRVRATERDRVGGMPQDVNSQDEVALAAFDQPDWQARQEHENE